MAKVIKGVIIGAAILFTGGLALGAIGGAGLVAGATSFGLTGLQALALKGAIYGGLSALSASLIKKPSADLGTANARLNSTVDAQAYYKWVFGKTAMPTDIVYVEQHGDKKQFVSYVLAAAGHEINGYGYVAINDEIVTFSGDSVTGDWSESFAMQRQFGEPGQVPLGDIDADDNWNKPSASTGTGIAHYRLRWTLGADKMASGIPSRLTIEGEGAKVYDPRLDSSRGGSGTHRADDQNTWEYSNNGNDIGANWALVLCWYWLGYRHDGKLTIGMGINPSNIDFDQVAAMANVCDTIRDGIPTYRVGGVFDCNGNHDYILGQLESAIGGKVINTGGKYYMWAPHNDLIPFGRIDEADILRDGGVSFSPSAPLETLVNTARGRYINPATTSLYQPTNYPEVVETTALADDEGERLLSHDFSIIQDPEIAQRVARMQVRRSRFSGTWSLYVGPKGLIFKPFSIAILNCRETDFEDVLVRVVDMSYSLSGIVRVDLLEEDASIYNTSDPLGTSVTQLDPDAFDSSTTISVSSLAVIPTSINGNLGTATDALKVSWEDPKGLVTSTEIQYKRTGGTEWSFVPAANVDFLTGIVSPLEPGSGYDVRVRHHTIMGVAGQWASASSATSSQQIAGLNGIIASSSSTLINASFEAGDTGWSAKSPEITIVNDPANARVESWCAKITNANAVVSAANDKTIPVGEGDRVTAQGFGKITSGTGSLHVFINFFESDNAYISTAFGTGITGSVYGKSQVLGSAPANAAYAKFGFYVATPTGLNGYLDGAYMNITDKISITSGTGIPTGGKPGDLYQRTAGGQWWANIANTWIKVSDETAQNQAASIANQGDLAVLDTAGTNEIDLAAVTDVFTATLTTNSGTNNGGQLFSIVVPPQFHDYRAVFMASCDAWVSTKVGSKQELYLAVTPGPYPVQAVTELPAVTAPGSRATMQFEWDGAANQQFSYNIRYTNVSSSDVIQARNINGIVLITKR